MDQAERAARVGEPKEAARLLQKAAECGARAFSHTPAARAKTRGLIAVNAVSLYLKAGVPAKAARLAQDYLDTAALLDCAMARLEHLLSSAPLRRHQTARPERCRAAQTAFRVSWIPDKQLR